MLPFHTRLIWLIPFPAEWHWLPVWCPGVHPSSYVNSEIWKKYETVKAQSSSSTVPVVGSMSSSSTSAQSMSSARPTPSCAPTLVPTAAQKPEPAVTQVTSGVPQGEDVPVPKAFPYVTQTVDSDRDDVQVIARTPFGSTLVQHVCRNMNDVEANEAVVNKNWFRQVADAEAPRFSSKMKQGVSTRLHMTRPQWVEQRLRKVEKQPFGLAIRTMVRILQVHRTLFHQRRFNFHCMLRCSLHLSILRPSLLMKQRRWNTWPLSIFSHCLRIILQQRVRRLRRSKNAFAKKKSMSKPLRIKRQTKKIRMKTTGSSTMSSCFEPVF